MGKGQLIKQRLETKIKTRTLLNFLKFRDTNQKSALLKHWGSKEEIFPHLSQTSCALILNILPSPNRVSLVILQFIVTIFVTTVTVGDFITIKLNNLTELRH